jgi:tetratricopeptide (TPR) repeat protein
MATTEIEKLERRYAENPQGLTFAPLAEVHRKKGDVARALELLKAGLELHPNYIPASIVLGRCHWDLGDLPAAESAFAHVLRLDDENVIALKSLADINEKLERFTEAQRWLNRLISIDRSSPGSRRHGSRARPVPWPRKRALPNPRLPGARCRSRRLSRSKRSRRHRCRSA